MTMMNIMNNALENKYYVAEVVGSKEYRVTRNFALLADAKDARRRIAASCDGKYVVKAA